MNNFFFFYYIYFLILYFVLRTVYIVIAVYIFFFFLLVLFLLIYIYFFFLFLFFFTSDCVYGNYSMRKVNISFYEIYMALKRAFFFCNGNAEEIRLLGAGVLGDGFGTFRHGVFCKFTRQQETNCSLDFPASDGGSLVVVSEARRFCSNSLEDVVHEWVHDRHSLAGDTSVGMDLFQNFVDVDSEGFLPALLPFLFVTSSNGFLGLTGLLDGFSGSLRRHFE